MSFTSVIFLMCFLPVCFLLCFFCRKQANEILFIASLFFYFWCGIKFLILLVISSTIAFLIGILLEKSTSNGTKKWLAVCGVGYELGVLFFYKYFMDCIGLVLGIFHSSAKDTVFANISIALPLGISFYTFSALSYILDVYWEKCEAQHNILHLYLYMMFFPKVVQGPIMRYSDFEKQLSDREMNLQKVDHGLQRFVRGMFKKAVIADQLTGLVAYSFEGITDVGTIPAWLGILGYLLQLYYDFSGYSDMAIGLGEMFGFSLPENFDHPYMAQTVAEYWRRWHISLGEWFRDYLYMPLYRSFLGNRLWKNMKNNALYADLSALVITWVFTGVWHGSGFLFIIYGLWYFAFIALERISNYVRKKIRKKKKLAKKPQSTLEKVCNHIVTFFAVVVGQVLFRSSGEFVAGQYLQKMFLWNSKDGWVFLTELTNSTVLALILGVVFVFPVWQRMQTKLVDRNACTQVLYRCLILVLFFISFAYSVSAGFSPFLYQVF